MNDPVLAGLGRRPPERRGLCHLVVDWTGRMFGGGAIVEPKLGVHPMPWFWCATAAEVEAKARATIGGGAEGVVIEAPLGTYRRTRSSQWQRIKRAVSLDAPIVELEPQPDCPWKLGALVVMLEGRRVRVSAGFSDTQRMTLWRDRARLAGTLAEIVMDSSVDGNPRAPRFLRLQPDKEQVA